MNCVRVAFECVCLSGKFTYHKTVATYSTRYRSKLHATKWTKRRKKEKKKIDRWNLWPKWHPSSVAPHIVCMNALHNYCRCMTNVTQWCCCVPKPQNSVRALNNEQKTKKNWKIEKSSVENCVPTGSGVNCTHTYILNGMRIFLVRIKRAPNHTIPNQTIPIDQTNAIYRQFDVRFTLLVIIYEKYKWKCTKSRCTYDSLYLHWSWSHLFAVFYLFLFFASAHFRGSHRWEYFHFSRATNVCCCCSI